MIADIKQVFHIFLSLLITEKQLGNIDICKEYGVIPVIN